MTRRVRTMWAFTGRGIVAYTLAATLAGGLVGWAGTVAMSEGHPVTGVITEDDPRWDCATMGNRTCGPSLVDLTDPFTRCLEAVEAAEIPGWMWECHQSEPAPAPSYGPSVTG